MRRILTVAALALMLVLGGVSGAMAAYMNPVTFMVYDTYNDSNGACGADGSATVTITDINLGTYDLDYSVDGSGWYQLISSGSGMTEDTYTFDSGSFPQQFWLRLSDGNNNYDYDANTTFSGTALCDSSLFTKLNIDWGNGTNFDIVTSCEGLAPVPAPGAALLLGSGLLGLVGVRRRKSQG